MIEGDGGSSASNSQVQPEGEEADDKSSRPGFDPPPRQLPRNPTTDIAKKCNNADADDEGSATSKSFTKGSFSNEAPYRLQNVENAAEELEEKDYDLTMSYIKVKSNDDFRVGYLKKLNQMKVLVPPDQRPPKHQTVCIFDWDDTLLCTTFLNSCPGGRVPVVAQEQLRAIATSVKQMLEVSLTMGTTFIITNAMSGWVEHSAEKWIPEVIPVLQKVQIISARTKYEPDFPDEVGQWKIQAFLDVQQRLDTDMVTNLLSVGDSNFEMDAIHVMGSKFSQALIKTVKLKQSPSPLELIKQLDLIVPKFEQVVNSGRNLKILCERKGPDAQAAKAGRK